MSWIKLSSLEYEKVLNRINEINADLSAMRSELAEIKIRFKKLEGRLYQQKQTDYQEEEGLNTPDLFKQ